MCLRAAGLIQVGFLFIYERIFCCLDLFFFDPDLILNLFLLALIGLALSYSSSITDSLTWLVRYMTALENNMNSVERVRHYTT